MLFNENGDAPGRYEIYQYQIQNKTAEYKIIGHWTDQLHLNVSMTLNTKEHVQGACGVNICLLILVFVRTAAPQSM